MLLDDDHRVIGYVEPGVRLEEHAWVGNHEVQGVERLLTMPTRVVWARWQGRLYETVARVAPLAPPEHGCTGQYILNHDRFEYVDKAGVRMNARRRRVHPLPILTVESGTGMPPWAGSWAHDRISLSDTVPEGFELWKFEQLE
ncbi:hypothetical protein [Nocardia tenerifensis]|uniref:hypothetical protein n=1 Tax=Nocardia tenerifensis TaxID=228006 RepID=UPI0011B47BAA|nr:hypothetical protein [Nocardia tenerifensis]